MATSKKPAPKGKPPAVKKPGKAKPRPLTGTPSVFQFVVPAADTEYNEGAAITVTVVAPDFPVEQYLIISGLVPSGVGMPVPVPFPLPETHPTMSDPVTGDPEGHKRYTFTFTAPDVDADSDLMLFLLFRPSVNDPYTVKRTRIIRIKNT